MPENIFILLSDVQDAADLANIGAEHSGDDPVTLGVLEGLGLVARMMGIQLTFVEPAEPEEFDATEIAKYAN